MHRTRDKGLWVIACFKLFKGFALLAVAIGALKLLHKDVAAVVSYWLDVLRVDPDNKYFQHVVSRLMAVNDHQLREISAGTFFYSAMLLTEGIGLFLEQRWAEYMTIIVTSSFVPIELYEVAVHFSIGKVILLIFNLVIVAYLVRVLRRKPIHQTVPVIAVALEPEPEQVVKTV